MTLTGVTCLVQDAVHSMPFALLIGILGASIIAPIPFLLIAMKQWISDLGKYGVLFPYVWLACFIVLILATFLDKNASVVPDDTRGWYSYVVMLGVTLCFSLVSYCGFFLLLCFLDVISQRFREFFFFWIFVFLFITLIIYTSETDKGDRLVNECDYCSRWKFWGGNDNSEQERDEILDEDICFLNPPPNNKELDCVDMRKCKTPAIY